MKQLRKIVFWCHLVAGVFAGIVVLIMSVTGVLLTYEKQIIRWADARSYNVVQPSPQAMRLPVETLLANARELKPIPPSTITLHADPSSAVEVVFGREGRVFVDPYTGKVLGEGSQGTRTFFRRVTDWHRWLGASGGGANREVGRAITGACNLAFLFLVVSGIYLWFPRRLTWRAIRNVAWFRRGLSGRARDFNWHNAIGFWSALPLFIVVLSATVISYTWASNLVYRMVGETPPAPRGAPNQPPGGGNAQRGGAERRNESGVAGGASLDNFDGLFARAAQQTQDWRSIQLQLPTAPTAPATFTIDTGTGGQPQKRAQLVLNRETGAVERWEPFANQTPGRRLRSILRFAHTGEVAGIIGQTIAGLASLGGVVLVWTGLALSWRRFRTWRARRSGGRFAGVDADSAEEGRNAQSGVADRPQTIR